MNTRFTGHYLLHDRGSAEDVDKLADIMSKRVGANFEVFLRPQPPYEFKENATAEESYSWMSRNLIPLMPVGSVIFGLGLGGLLAAKLQEDFPTKNLSVVVVNASVSDGNISLTTRASTGRVALFSKEYAGASDWTSYTSQAYDLPWLAHGVKNVRYGTAFLFTEYMAHEYLVDEVARFYSDPIV